MLRFSLVTVICLAVIAPSTFGETVTGSVRAGNSLYRDGKYQEALDKYRAAQVESPTDERVMFNLGNAQYKLGRYDEALSEYLGSTQGEDKMIQAQSHYNAGNALYRAGRLEEAVEQYLKALKIDPDDEDAKFNLEFVRREIRRRMNEQQRRQERQERQENQEKQEGSTDRDSQEQGDKEEDRRNKPGRQQEADKEKEESEGENQSPERSGKKEQPEQEHGSSRTDATRQQMSIDETNMQRWLDAIEAETAENMKEFLRNQQPVDVIAYPEDW
jgi:Ca-activated chloride channel family protein